MPKNEQSHAEQKKNQSDKRLLGQIRYNRDNSTPQ